MIKGIMGSKSVVVSGGSMSLPYVPYNSSNPIQGMLRVNGQDLQTFDGSNWVNVSTSYPTVELTSEVESLLDWARAERARQLKRAAMIKNHPALQKAYEAIQGAEANFDLLEKFVENDQEASEVQASP